ncbi:MAG: cytochrome c [Deltaproteobacteria bacterium]|nr:cytochrome c [Deltaproteobacteria bacterium]
MRLVFRHLALVLCVLPAAVAGCSRESTAPAPAAQGAAAKKSAAPDPETVAAKEEAKQIFASTCSPCHGVSGAGNGTRSDEFVPPPRNFQDPGWQTSVTDAYIEKIVVQGGEAVGKSAAMPANADLASKPLVVAALREYIRRLATP